MPLIENIDASDYIQEGDVGFKKPKKKRRANRRAMESEDAAGNQDNDAMQIDDTPAPSANLDTNFVDDDELQAALARSRKAKMRKMPKLNPEEIARRSRLVFLSSTPNTHIQIVAEEREAEVAEAHNAMKEEEEVGLTIDDTSEFVQAVSLDAKPERRIMVLETVKHEASEDEDMEELETGEIDPRMEEEMLALKMELDKQFADEEVVKHEGPDLQVSDILPYPNQDLRIAFVGWHSCRKDPQHRVGWHIEYSTVRRIPTGDH